VEKTPRVGSSQKKPKSVRGRPLQQRKGTEDYIAKYVVGITQRGKKEKGTKRSRGKPKGLTGIASGLSGTEGPLWREEKFFAMVASSSTQVEGAGWGGKKRKKVQRSAKIKREQLLQNFLAWS